MSSKRDRQRTEFAKLVYHLRQVLDLYRVIGLNSGPLSRRRRSTAFWIHVKMLAHESIAATVCKLFEREDRYGRNSIPAVITALPNGRWKSQQRAAVVLFAKKYGVSANMADVKSYLRCALYCFECSNKQILDDLREFRDKHVAHSEAGYKLRLLPSIETFEQIFAFANDFYQMVTRDLFESGPDTFDSHVGRAAINLMTALRIQNPTFDFEVRLGRTTT